MILMPPHTSPKALNDYTAVGINFDGTNDYLKRGGNLTGLGDGKLGIMSVWMNPGNLGASKRIFTSTTNRITFLFNASNFFHIVGRNTSGGVEFQMQFAGVGLQWQHLLASWDLGNNIGWMRINDRATQTAQTKNDVTLDYTEADYAIGADVSGANKLNGDIADLYINLAETLADTEANHRKFIDEFGRPVDLGSDGSTPTGTAPIVYLSGALATWETNDGTGGGFNETGEITAAATSPSD